MSTTDQPSYSAAARAHANIALVKYWGKQDGASHNQPAVASLSLTLDALITNTRVSFDPGLKRDHWFLNGEEQSDVARLSSNLDRVRQLSDCTWAARVESENNFPTAAGLASSASGYAALQAAACRALAITLSEREQSMLARSMSGSAARSLAGGFVQLDLANRSPHGAPWSGSFARQIFPASHWPLEVVVGIVSQQAKSVSSTRGMEHTQKTSPYYPAWIEGNDQDVQDAAVAIAGRDFEKLADISEYSCLKMHASAMAARPGLIYWQPATLEAIQWIRAQRQKGIPVFFTVDAGPQIKAVCAPGYGQQISQELSQLPGILQVIHSGLGPGVSTWD